VVDFNWDQPNSSPLQLVKTMQFAASLPGVSVVTSRWLWTDEPAREAKYDSYPGLFISLTEMDIG